MKKILVKDPALRKVVRKKFTSAFDNDNTFFKMMIAKSLGIKDPTEPKVKNNKEWKNVSLQFNKP